VNSPQRRRDGASPWLARVVCRARFLWEREAAGPPPHEGRGTRSVERRLHRWRSLLAAAGPSAQAAWQRRLAIGGLDESRIAALLADPVRGVPAAWPDWGAATEGGDGPFASATAAVSALSDALREVQTLAADTPGADPGPSLLAEAATRVPFADLLVPLVHRARRGLAERLAGDPAAALEARAWRSLERALLMQLATVAGPVLQHEFERGLGEGERLLRRLGPVPADPGRSRYGAFVAGLRADGGRALFTRYPVLARLLATALAQWQAVVEEFCLRLAADRDAIAARFAADAGSLGRVARLRASLSDAHCGGRSTLMLQFENGMALLYKPKSLAQDEAFGALIDWCNRHGAPLAMRHVAVLDRGSHGWSSFVAHRTCTEPAARSRFYRRAGQLLALLHLLRGTDAHVENVVADGEHPVLVDTETLCHPELRGDLGFGEPGAAPETVLRTGLLPDFEGPLADALEGDISGLATWQADGLAGASLVWQAINTDAMHRRSAVVRPTAANAPLAEGAGATLTDFEPEVVAGFEAMVRFLVSRRDALRAGDGPLAAWNSLPVRHVLRATRIYAEVMNHALTPQALSGGADFSIALERLAVAWLHAAPADAAAARRAWRLLEAEQRACGRLDVPMFSARTDALWLDDGSGTRIDGLLRDAARSEMAAQLERLGEADLAAQRDAIRASFAALRDWRCRGAAVLEETA